MREILFRGKRTDNGKWVVGMLARYNPKFDTANIVDEFEILVPVIAKTVGQYTGLTDKNGTKIFEGDVVLMPSYHGGKHKTTVYFKNGKFAVDGSNYNFKDICPKNMEVIGNIHDGILNGGAANE